MVSVKQRRSQERDRDQQIGARMLPIETNERDDSDDRGKQRSDGLKDRVRVSAAVPAARADQEID